MPLDIHSASGELAKRQPTFQQTAFSVPQVAARWGVSSRHIYDLCARSELGHLRIGNLIRVRASDLEEYEEKQWQAPGSVSSAPPVIAEPKPTARAYGNAFQRGQISARKLKPPSAG